MLSMCTLTPTPPHTHSHYKSMSVTKITKRGFNFLGKALAFKKILYPTHTLSILIFTFAE